VKSPPIMAADSHGDIGNSHAGSAREVFQAFLKLGFTSFGGPIAHLGYFRAELVVRRNWIEETGYADLLALCQIFQASLLVRSGIGMRWA
jgi:chromate transporter